MIVRIDAPALTPLGVSVRSDSPTVDCLNVQVPRHAAAFACRLDLRWVPGTVKILHEVSRYN